MRFIDAYQEPSSMHVARSNATVSPGVCKKKFGFKTIVIFCHYIQRLKYRNLKKSYVGLRDVDLSAQTTDYTDVTQALTSVRSLDTFHGAGTGG